MIMYRIEHYLSVGEHKDLYIDWLQRLRDSQAKVAVVRRVTRVELGNFGDHKFCRDGVWELRIDVGPGVLRPVGASCGAATVRRRQADAGCGHYSGGRILAGLATENG